MLIETYLTFPGTAEAAMAFYADVFETEVTDLQRMGEMPGMPPMSDETAQRIGHARIMVQGRLIMASDAADEFSGPHQGFHGFSLSAQCGNVAEANALFNQLAEGGEITMPMAKTFWAPAFGMCRDKFGVPWMVNCEEDET